MAKKYTDADETALRDFLLDEDCLEKLLPWTGKFNIFDVLKISRAEIRHSNMLGWLLDPNENHGLGDKFLKALFKIALNNSSKFNAFDMLLLDYYSFSVYREWKNIDILLVSREEKFIIAIENKVGSHEHSDQLSRYRTILEKEYESYKRFYFYLTPDGEESSDPKNWNVLTYRDLVDELEQIIDNIELLPDAELMIKNYINIIRRDIVEDQELIDICNKIYEKHKRALDLIYENKTDNRTVITDTLLDSLKKYENEGILKIEESTVSNSIIAFSTQEMDNFLPVDERNINSWGTNTIYRYYIQMRDYPDITAKFELGGCHFDKAYADAVDKITHILKPNDNREIFKYKRLYSTKKYRVDEDCIEDSCQKIVDAIVKDLMKMQKNVIEEMKK